jgi:hypothetical protein
MRPIPFTGGAAAGSLAAQFTTTGRHARQIDNAYPADADLNNNLEGLSNVFYLSSINPTGLSGSYTLRLNKGGADYVAPGIISGTSGGTCEIRIYKNGSSTVYFGRRGTSNGLTTVKEYSGDTLTYTWGTQMTGSYYYCTVPGAPASITATRIGLTVNVTYTNSTDDGGDPITSYTIQRAIVTGGTNGGSDGTVGTWTTHSNSTLLSPGTMYRFRVYATNPAGNSVARTSTNVFISVYGERFNGSSWVDVTNYSRFNGTSWVGISNFKRFDGTAWQNMTDKS